MPRELYVMRHAKSSWGDASLADLDRPLSKRGKRDAEAMGHMLARKGLSPDLILVSPAKRASSTLKRLVKASGYTGDTRIMAELYDTLERLLRGLANLPEGASRVLLIGHNPALENLVHLFTGSTVLLPTAAIACIILEVDTWAEVGFQTKGTLRFVLTPQIAGDDDA